MQQERRILIVSQAISQDYFDLLKQSFPEGTHFDVISGNEIVGCILYKSPKHESTSIKARLRCWLSFYQYVRKWLKNNKYLKYDLIYCISNPPINAYLGIKLKKRFNSKFVYMYWDIYPQVIEALLPGSISKVVSMIWNNWNKRNFKKIDQIITIGKVVGESIQKRIPYDLNIEIIPIPADTELIQPIDKEKNDFLIHNGLQDKFIILYSGKMGKGHNIEIILDAAKKLENNKNIVFVFIGDGEKRILVEKHINSGHTDNVKLFPLQPYDLFPISIACGDIGIVSQEKSSAQYFMPSKTFSMMAAGEAIIGICSEHDDLQQMINDCRIGYALHSNNCNDLCEKILYLYNNINELLKLKERARISAVRRYSRQIVIDSYKTMFNRVLSK